MGDELQSRSGFGVNPALVRDKGAVKIEQNRLIPVVHSSPHGAQAGRKLSCGSPRLKMGADLVFRN